MRGSFGATERMHGEAAEINTGWTENLADLRKFGCVHVYV